MSDPLGLSIGTTNLVAARVGNPPISRRSVLGRPGQMLSGFVERVGDPVPLVAADGSSHQADVLMVEALDGMIMAAGGDQSADLSVAVPAHWNAATLRALRIAMRARPRLSPNGTPARLVSDAVASLTALAANPGLPRRGVVALMDFGGGGTSITLADASSGYEPIETVRLTDFSGEQIDQALLAHVLEGIADSDDADTDGTTAVGSLAALRDQCRIAKEALSEATVADVSFNLQGHSSAVRVTRSELESLMAQPLSMVLTELDDVLQRNRIPWADVATVAAVGGGARIPMINVELSKHTKTGVVTTPQPAFDAAVGAAIFAAYGVEADARTGVAPAPLIAEDPDATGVANAAGASAAAALAWSQDDDTDSSLQPYTGEDYDTTSVRAPAQWVQPTGPVDDDKPRSWHRLPQLVFGLAAIVAVAAVSGVAIALTSVDEGTPAPTKTPTTTVLPPPPPPTSVAPPPVVEPPPPPPPSVVTVTSVAPPPPPPETKYVEVPPKTTTTTTTQPTTTTTTTTTETTTTTTTTETTTSTTPPMTTSYITVPFVPVPIPIQVPNSGQPSQQQQYPQYQQPQYGQPQYPGQYGY